MASKITVLEAITEEQATIIRRGENPEYPIEEHIADIDLIAELTELKIAIRRKYV